MSSDIPAPASDLQDFIFRPSGPVRGTAILIHGHGDYSSRYESILQPFLNQGICCLATDLPGHGESPGRRGFIDGIHAIDEMMRKNRRRARSICPDGPIGLIGHSVGGLLALRELLYRSEEYQFTWISSPLLRPDATRHPIVVALLRVLGSFLPNLPLDTGVTATDCRHFDGAEEEEEDWGDGLFHSQISLGWGRTLLLISEEVAKGYSTLSADLPVLFTQGTADPVCAVGFLREFLASSKLPRATSLEFEGLLHEPFTDSSREEVLGAIGGWLEETLGALTS